MKYKVNTKWDIDSMMNYFKVNLTFSRMAQSWLMFSYTQKVSINRNI